MNYKIKWIKMCVIAKSINIFRPVALYNAFNYLSVKVT